MKKIAIICAAGIGNRLKPLTLAKHKSLVLIKTKPLIEVIINYLLTLKTITKIIIITGYQQEKFHYLMKLYPQVSLVYNPFYITAKSAIVLQLIAPELISNHDLYFISGDFVMKSNCFSDTLNVNVMAAITRVDNKNDWSYQLDDNGGIKQLVKTTANNTLIASEWNHITTTWAKQLYQDLQKPGATTILKTMDLAEYLIAKSTEQQIVLKPYLIDHHHFWDLDDFTDLERINNEF